MIEKPVYANLKLPIVVPKLPKKATFGTTIGSFLLLPFPGVSDKKAGYKTTAISKYDCQIFPQTQ